MRECKLELLADIFELASEPVADPEEIRQNVEAFFYKLEEEADGEKTRTATREQQEGSRDGDCGKHRFSTRRRDGKGRRLDGPTRRDCP